MDYNTKRQREVFGFSDLDLEYEAKQAKHNYWRGFRVGVIACVPFIIALMWGLTVALNAMQ